MNDSYAGEIVVLLMSFFALIVPFFFFIWTASWASKGLGKLGNALQSGMQRTAQRAGNLGKKAAMNSKYGQAAQQFMGQRKAIAQLKGKEALRSALNTNPNLKRLMGGVGGKQYASRFLNQENRRHEAEQIQELSKNMSLPMANAIAGRQNLLQATAGRNWVDKNGRDTGKEVTAEDRAGIRQLQEQGYVDAGGRISAGHPHSAIAASAALQEIYNSDDVSAEKLQGLGGLLKGAGVEANSNFTKLNRDLAVKGKNKNVAFASFNDGEMNQFQGKKPSGIMDSGLQGMNKDALKWSNADLDGPDNRGGGNAILKKLRQESFNADGSRNLSAVVERTKQTIDQSHKEVVEGLSYAMGFGSVNPEQLSNMKKMVAEKQQKGQQVTQTERAAIASQEAALEQQVNSFQQLRRSMTSGNTTPPPPEFQAFMGGTAQAAPQSPPQAAPQQPQLIVPHSPPSGSSNRPRPSNFPPAGPPAGP